ncbi:MAG: AAA family ATPase [Clostridia bacterium]|nr:AAA family ATPase [Clostridia bacterium]
MKIQKIKINGFGKLQNKEIEFDEKINLIQGENESGKSTLLKFILAMFYGTSRNKNGKFIADYERYKPWNTEEYSGKIEYKLDNGEEYEVFREFKRKSPKIYNDQKEDITKKYGVDKSKESTFFLEQTGIGEENFFATSAVEQTEIKLTENMKNSIIQKLSNIAVTGNESISYKKTIETLNKKQMEEIGTYRSNGRPINIVNDEIKKLETEREKLKVYEEKRNNINENKSQLEGNLAEDTDILELLRKQKTELEKQELKKTKLKYIESQIDNNYNTSKTKPKRQVLYSIAVILMILIAIMTFLTKNPIVLTAIIIPIIIIAFGVINKASEPEKKTTNKQPINEKEEEYKKEKIEFQNEKNKKEQEIINEFKNKIDEDIIKEILSLKYEKVVEYISEKEREIADYKIGKKEVEIQNEAIEENLERLIEIEEKLTSLKNDRIELNKLNKIYEIVKEEITNSYEEIRKNITPDFLKEFKNILAQVTNNKYTNAYLDQDNQIMIEIENGKYIGIDHLSTGTIDLIYLSLRISAIQEMTNEKMPILLDESFAYYDEPRLENIIRYITQNYENQVFILTCSNREKEIMEKNKIEYNQIIL